MAGVTIPYGFELPLGVEKISVPLLNRNFTKINDVLKGLDESKLEIKQGVSAYMHPNFRAYNSSFTRISIGNTGVVIAKIGIQILSAGAAAGLLDIPTPGYKYLEAHEGNEIVPPGFGSKDGMYPVPAAIAGNGVNQEIQGGISGYQFGYRRSASNTPTAFTNNTVLYLNYSYQWNGLET